ncbi:MAG TPA: hypothetical protein VMH20_05050 [Verrucomicrobiae bacterium]|nr:hypothetical protein [Verrucomicrobiae bacterium]
MFASLLFLLAVTVTLSVPVLLVWGWVRWANDENPRSRSSTSSLVGFVLATASAGLALGTHLYAVFVHGFHGADPTLLKIYACGSLLSVVGIGFSFAGSGKPNPVRWLAPICSIGTLVFWLLAMGSE